MTTRPLSEFFEMAIQYVPPFVPDKGKKGKGFVVPLRPRTPESKFVTILIGLLVTDDEVFSKVDINKFMPTCVGLRLKVLSFDEAFNVLYDGYWDEHVKRPWEEERRIRASRW